MKYLFNSRLGDTRYRLADGSLLCKDVPIARTGKQLYGEEEFPELEPDEDGEIVVNRTPEEVFSPEAMASFEGMSVTLLHPEDDLGNLLFVDPENWRELAVGHTSDVRRGEGEQSELLLADLIIKDEVAIDAIESGLREVSCGYDAKYRQKGRGNADQHHITGNHVALVPKGRAGIICSIGDSDTMATVSQSWFNRLKRAVKTGDMDTLTEMTQTAPRSITGDSDDIPGVVNINLSPQQPLPAEPKPIVGATVDDDAPAWVKTIMARLDKLEGRTADNGEDDKDKEKEKTGDGEGEEKDEKEEKATGDSAYRAELIMPGVNLDRSMKPTAFKREVLAAADQALVRQIVGDADVRKMNRAAVDVAFNAVSELAKSRNTATRTADASRTVSSTIESINQRNREFWDKRGK
ncbi:DUF2213 domain-containing protein [Pantoea stewartii]|uniref:DUF2213 domain-containing protein n=1 Tax=Pantoea stewartii TaxID=66269 RepID=UPI001627633F|nr:DUF2213 domain-containing protein [Pantoea stewartii]MBC0852626.1 DUF2213 domain-containing protein [Pantoea stewartii]